MNLSVSPLPHAEQSCHQSQLRRRPTLEGKRILILIAFITGNSSLEPLIEGLCAQIHVNLR